MLEWVAYPIFSGSYPGIEPGSPALQVDSLSTELSLPSLKKEENSDISYREGET